MHFFKLALVAAATTATATAAVRGATPADWKTCGGLPDARNRTACPSSSTCCTQKWAPGEGNWGCAPFENAVCCDNGYTACPNDYHCKDTGSGWAVVTECIPNHPNPAEPLPGVQVCKQGAPLPFDTARKNVLILGDSVSIGYTPSVAQALGDVALVQHSPWGGDGGAEETAYGWQCLDFLLRAPDGEPLSPDVLFFNFGLHNINPNSTIPGQAGPPSDYAPYLEKIAAKLAQWTNQTKAKLMFALTSPMLNSVQTDNIVLANNRAAAEIMKRHSIPMVDLHAPIVTKCGPVPQASCFGENGCWSPHCPPGYDWLARSVVAPAIRGLLGV